jgi:hypothetical protein
VPFKLDQDRRHHIPRQRRKVTKWPAYEAGLRQRGSMTEWFTEEAVAAWAAAPRITRGGQPFYSPLAILTAQTLRAVFRLAYRQAEELIGSIINLLSLTLPLDKAATAPTQRDRHLQDIAEKGRMTCQKTSDYNRRVKVEAAIGRWRQVIGNALHSRMDERRVTEVNVAVEVLSRMLELGRPNYVRIV